MPLSPVTRLPKALVPEGRIISAPTKFGRTVTRSPKALVPEGRYCVAGDVNPRKQVGIKLTQPRRGGIGCPGMCSRINIAPSGLEGVWRRLASGGYHPRLVHPFVNSLTLDAGSLQRPVAHTTDYRAPRKDIFSPLSTRVRHEHGLKGEKRRVAFIV